MKTNQAQKKEIAASEQESNLILVHYSDFSNLVMA